MKTEAFKLADREFTIHEMQYADIEDAFPIILSMQDGDTSKSVTRIRQVVQIAVRGDYPDADVSKLRCSIAEMGAAFAKISEINGFVMKARLPGEGQPRAGKSTSRKSARG